MSFTDKVVIVTGAGSGMGKAIAIHFAKSSAKLTLVDKNEETLTKTMEDCQKVSKNRVINIAVDLAVDTHCKDVVHKTIGEYGRLDILINCIGIHSLGGILDPNIMEVYDRLLSVNLRSFVAITSFAAQELIKTKGVIINISSISSILVTRNTLIYNVSKAGLTHFTKRVALELASYGVRVNCIIPGGVKTNLLVNCGISDADDETFWNEYVETVPLKRIIDPEEIADLVAFLASDKAKSITGADFAIDGGSLVSGHQDPPKMLKNEGQKDKVREQKNKEQKRKTY